MSHDQEIEIKLQIPPAARPAVEQAVATGAARQTHLQARYFDTADHRLGAAGIALRLRKEGPRWVQTLKAGSPHGLQRLEHNVPVDGTDAPGLDLQRHAGTPAGALLMQALAGPGGRTAPLIEQYGTDIRRWHRVLDVPGVPGGRVELAFDEGRIQAQGRDWPVCELEIELVEGPAQLVIDQARHWARDHGLWLDTRSKAERGERLARGELGGAAVPAAALVDAGTAVADALAQILPNASDLAGGQGSDEQVRELCSGIRHLEAALPPCAGAASAPPSLALRTLADLGRTLDRAPSNRTGLLRAPAVTLALLDLLAHTLDRPASHAKKQ